MTEPKRQLAAIMFTDIVGYTALMGKDEQKALALLKKNKEIHEKFITQYNGRLLKEIGDGILASFNSVSEAVYCAGAVQKAASDEYLNLRIGIHEGEVVFQDNDVFGDGVNIASRIEGLAENGQILISESVYQNIKNNKAIESTYLGTKELKNIDEPLRIYSVDIPELPDEVVHSNDEGLEEKTEVNSIAVLPFTNMSSDPEQEYFADGLTEEILNSITQIKELKVVGRTSSFQFKGENIDLRDVGKKLKVHTILEGSIRKQGTRIRVTAQLINVEDGYHIWSERFDRELIDIFEIQDQIAMSVVERLKKDLASSDRKAIEKRYTNDPEVLNQYLLAKFYYNKRTPDGFDKALKILDEIIRNDSNYAPAYVTIADCYRLGLIGYGTIPREVALKGLKESSEKALKIDPELDSVHASLGHTNLVIEWDFQKSKKHLLKALEINPGNVEALQWLGWYYLGAMNYKKSSDYFTKALNIDPLSAVLHTEAGWSYHYDGDLEKAKSYYKKAIEIDPSYALAYYDYGTALLVQGKEQEGFSQLEKAINIWGNLGFFLGVLGHFQARTGNVKKAKKTLGILIKQHELGLSLAFNIADIYEGMGKIDETLKWLNISYLQNEVLVFAMWPWRTGFLQSYLLKDHPGLHEIMKKVGLPYS